MALPSGQRNQTNNICKIKTGIVKLKSTNTSANNDYLKVLVQRIYHSFECNVEATDRYQLRSVNLIIIHMCLLFSITLCDLSEEK